MQTKQQLIKKIAELEVSLEKNKKNIQDKRKELRDKRNILESLIQKREMKEVNKTLEN